MPTELHIKRAGFGSAQWSNAPWGDKDGAFFLPPERHPDDVFSWGSLPWGTYGWGSTQYQRGDWLERDYPPPWHEAYYKGQYRRLDWQPRGVDVTYEWPGSATVVCQGGRWHGSLTASESHTLIRNGQLDRIREVNQPGELPATLDIP